MRRSLEPCVSDVLLFWLFKYANWDLHSILLKRQDMTFAFHRQALYMCGVFYARLSSLLWRIVDWKGIYFRSILLQNVVPDEITSVMRLFQSVARHLQSVAD